MTPEEIALFIEEAYAEIAEDRVVEHLRGCKRCFALYQDSARDSGIWGSSPDVFAPSPEAVTAGRELLSSVRSGEQDDRSRTRRRNISRGWWGRWQYGVGVVGITLVVAVWFGGNRAVTHPSLASDITNPIRVAVERASSYGPMVIPGGENGLGVESTVYRSGFVEENDSLSASMLKLLTTYQAGDPSREVARWLIRGLLATGQVDAARDYSRDARQLYPEDGELTTLAALIAYHDRDYGASEKLLREVVGHDSDDVVALYNLAVTLHEQAQSADAAKILIRISTRHQGPLADRADSLLAVIRRL